MNNIGDKVKISNPILPPGGNGCHPKIGTIGEISRKERGWIIVKFPLPLVDLKGNKWIATQDRQEVEQSYEEYELEVLNEAQ